MMHVLRLFLYHEHWAVIVCGSILVIVAALGSRKRNKVLLVAYLAFIVYMTLASRKVGSGGLRPVPFRTYKGFWSNSYRRMQIMDNIWLFVPMGAILYRLKPKWYVVFVPVLISIVIEVAQYVLDLGVCEFDDVFNNGLGGVIGVVLCWVIVRLTSV